MAEYRRLPTITQLRHLVALADHRHFGRAAAACFVTQSSLSASIKELEKVFGRILAERTKRHVMVTPMGASAARRARAILTQVEDLVDLVQAGNTPLGGELRLGVIPTIAPFLLPRILPTIRRAHPGLGLYLGEAQSADLVDGCAK
ncbi:MAG: LysR family transcriptional regulator [Rhodospirillales bacterium]|jgi:LysR family hydrogen peroxide-inducible transcriptional activator|nr:hypothetical protein [Rhodospirillaceae bacterium]MDP6842192.1 LysR family transcriptional regulator [Rhodospirillales bacterium]